MSFSARTSCREVPDGHVEVVGQALNLIDRKTSLPVAAVTSSGAHGGVAPPAHELGELGLSPSVALAQDANVGGDDRGLAPGDLARSWGRGAPCAIGLCLTPDANPLRCPCRG